jgi:hypothetical protein
MTVPVFTGNVPNRLSSPETFSADTDSYHAELGGVIAGMNETAIAMNLNSTTDTSSTSLAISLGSKSLTVSIAKSFQAGMYLILADSAAPSTNSMVVQVTSYNAGTGAMAAECVQVKGSGTKTSWVISQSASPSLDISAAMLPVTSASTIEAARTALGSTTVGDAVFVAANATVAQAALDVYSKAEIAIPNLIDNSNFAINQRGVVSTVTLAAGAYGHDRWKAGVSGCVYDFSASGGITTITISSGSLVQVVNGVELLTGAYKVHWTGTAQGRVVGGSYATDSFTVTAVAGSNLSLEFGIGTLSKVKMNEGTVSNKWYMPNTQDELMKCQKYVVKLLSGVSLETLGLAASSSSTAAICIVPLQVKMNATPTLTYLSGNTTNLAFGSPISGTLSGISAVSLGNDGKSIRLDLTGTGLTVGASILRQNSGTPILIAAADL